ncbi:MAG: YqiA/YcfP family alpha/beta fold hydrolase [Porticoccaceae bacterium]
MHLLYLHGYNSSPDSTKARQLQAWLAREHPNIEYVCPFQSPFADKIGEQLLDVSKDFDWSNTLVIGSSMGGFFATWLAEKFACKAVLINPAVRPWEAVEDLAGTQTNYHTGETFILTEQDVNDFRHYGVDTISHPENLWVLLQTADEVLDYRKAESFYKGCRLTIEEGGDHSFQGFERFFSDIIRFWKP